MITPEKVRKLRKLIEKASLSLDDTDALEAIELFERWKPGLTCVAQVRYFYNDKLYRCEQAHTAQEGWEPDIAPALFTEVARPGEIPVWKQPTGAQDAYQTGEKVHYPTADDPVYISTVDNNVWPPDVYGWELFES